MDFSFLEASMSKNPRLKIRIILHVCERARVWISVHVCAQVYMTQSSDAGQTGKKAPDCIMNEV